MENKYINSEICTNCGGMCCKHMGCHIAPSDLKEVTYDYIKDMIMTGTVSLDYWEGNPFEDDRDIERAYFLRMRNKGAAICDASWGGECIILTDHGCPLSFKDRPKGARLLVPQEKGECILEYDKQVCAKDWYQYNDILDKIWNEYKGLQDTTQDALDNVVDKTMQNLIGGK